MNEELDRFIGEVCLRRNYLVWIFLIAVGLITIQLPYLFLVEMDSELFVIATINVVGFGAFAAASGLMIRHCDRR